MEAYHSTVRTMETDVTNSTMDLILGEIGLVRIEVRRIRGIIPTVRIRIRFLLSPLPGLLPGGHHRPLDFRDLVLVSRRHLRQLITAAVAAAAVPGAMVMDTGEVTVVVTEGGTMAATPHSRRRHRQVTTTMGANTTGPLPCKPRADVTETGVRTTMAIAMVVGGVTEVGAGTIDRPDTTTATIMHAAMRAINVIFLTWDDVFGSHQWHNCTIPSIRLIYISAAAYLANVAPVRAGSSVGLASNRGSKYHISITSVPCLFMIRL